jgi:hypothetical protein
VEVDENEEQSLRLAALETSKNVLSARQRAERDLIQANESLEIKTKELAKTLATMRAMLESTTEGIVVMDGRDKVMNFNEKYVAMWKMPREFLEAEDYFKAKGIRQPPNEKSSRFHRRHQADSGRLRGGEF